MAESKKGEKYCKIGANNFYDIWRILKCTKIAYLYDSIYEEKLWDGLFIFLPRKQTRVFIHLFYLKTSDLTCEFKLKIERAEATKYL